MDCPSQASTGSTAVVHSCGAGAEVGAIGRGSLMQGAGWFSGTSVQALLMEPVLDGGHGGQCDEHRALAAASTGAGCPGVAQGLTLERR
jgi:hypothetical protein